MSSVILYLALIFAFVASPSTLCTGLMEKVNSETDPIVLTCRKVSDFGFCVIILRSDSRSARASVPEVAHIALDILRAHTKLTSNCLHRLEESATVQEKKVIDTCIDLYGRAMNGDVPTAMKFLGVKDYGNARKAVLGAMNDEEGCQQELSKNPSTKWQLQITRNVYTRDLCQLSSDLIGLLK